MLLLISGILHGCPSERVRGFVSDLRTLRPFCYNFQVRSSLTCQTYTRNNCHLNFSPWITSTFMYLVRNSYDKYSIFMILSLHIMSGSLINIYWIYLSHFRKYILYISTYCCHSVTYSFIDFLSLFWECRHLNSL